MTDNNQSTPERELLKLIEAKKQPPSLTDKSYMRKGLSLFSLGAMRGRFSFMRDSLRKILSGNFSLDIGGINRFLTVLALAMFFLLTFHFVNSIIGIEEQVEASFKADEKSPPFKFQEVSVLKKSSYYLEKARKRDIFAMTKDMPKIEKGPGNKPLVIKDVVKKTEGFKLVGISWSDEPDAMIEDSKSKKTFFVRIGDLINDVKVESISRDKVILSYEGEEVELE